MTIQLYHNNDERIKIGKSLTAVGTQMTGTLKERCNITDPVITLELSNDVIANGVDYMYISDFGRFYFIENITVVASNVFQMICHVDVLESFKTPLKQLNAVISRQEEDGKINTYLNDDQYICRADPFIATVPFKKHNSTDDFKFGTSFDWVLAVAGGQIS